MHLGFIEKGRFRSWEEVSGQRAGEGEQMVLECRVRDGRKVTWAPQGLFELKSQAALE